MNETQLRDKLKTLSDEVGLSASNFTMSDKPGWFLALVQYHKLRGEAIPGDLIDLARRYGRIDSELDAAIKATEGKEVKKVGATKKAKA